MSETPRAALERMASLARIELTGAEAAELAPQLARILEAFEVLARQGGAAPSSASAAAEGRLRPDALAPCLERDRLLANAPEAHAGFFAVPRTLGGAPGEGA